MELKNVHLGDIIEVEIRDRDNLPSLAIGYIKELTSRSVSLDMFNPFLEIERGFLGERSRETCIRYDKICKYRIL